MRQAMCPVWAVLGVVVLFSNTVTAQLQFQTVALTGQSAPGLAPDIQYQLPGAPALNSTGQVAIVSTLSGTGVNDANDYGIWAADPTALQLVAREGAAAPGAGADVNFFFLYGPTLNSSGQVAFLGHLTLPGSETKGDEAIFAGLPGSLQLVSRASQMGIPALNASGQLAFATNAGIQVGSAGSFQFVARSGDPAPGTSAGTDYNIIYTNAALLNDAGHVAFTAYLDGPGVNMFNEFGYWSGLPGAIDLVARDGDPAAGIGGGVTYSALTSFQLSSTGEVVFCGTLSDAGSAVWVHAGGGQQLVARDGDPAAGMGAGFTYGGVDPDAVINSSGQVAFSASLNGPGVPAGGGTIWSGLPGSLQPVVHPGDPAPSGGGASFEFLSAPLLNDNGEIIFTARLVGAGIDDTNDGSLWARSPDNRLLLIAREGSLLEVAPGDLRMVEGISYNGSRSDGYPSSFDNSGKFAFSVSFADGSTGVFVTTIPEPESSRLVAAALCCLGGFTGLARARSSTAGRHCER